MSLVVGIVGVILHNALYSMYELEEPVSFVIALLGLWVLSMTSAASVVMFLKGRRKTT